ncbi:progranulin [Hyalella azteca]|uniref:Progranulin n=1 Tax=Hyalella azteca TaxID=294128 RepID=A0A8B7N937_HYAAZ|nr:progranulin [Hyalella azteca]XP_047736610.1 progranulin [Hyalella azteca]
MATCASDLIPKLFILATIIGIISCKTCPDNTTDCRDNNTCCPLLRTPHFACCPYANGVCCSDHVHCCPGGTTCDLDDGTCNAKAVTSILAVMQYLMQTSLSTIPLTSLTPGQALKDIAADHPNSVLERSSRLSPESGMYASITEALRNGTSLRVVPCPDHSVCPDSYTCCAFADNTYGCCPYSQGVCCPDHLSCCPHNSECTSHRTCKISV